MRRITNSAVIGVLALAFGWPMAAAGAEFHVDAGADNTVRFISDAPVEDFEGVTTKIDGYVFWPGASLESAGKLDESEFYFEVPLATLETGIKLRDSHMRENYLETQEFPYAVYSGKLRAIDKAPDGSHVITVGGDFTLHGVTRPLELAAHVMAVNGGFVVEAAFVVKLTDFGIEVPSLMFLKINEAIQLELSFRLKPAPEKP